MGPSRREIVRDLVNAKAEAEMSHQGEVLHILHQAAMYGIVELVEHCLKEGCQVDMVTTQGPTYPYRFGSGRSTVDSPNRRTPLAYACAEGHTKVVRMLLKHEAPFEEERPHSANLWVAAYQGHADGVNLLPDKFKASHSSEEVANFLLQRPHPKCGQPILFAGASSGKAGVVEVCASGSSITERNTKAIGSKPRRCLQLQLLDVLTLRGFCSTMVVAANLIFVSINNRAMAIPPFTKPTQKEGPWLHRCY